MIYDSNSLQPQQNSASHSQYLTDLISTAMSAESLLPEAEVDDLYQKIHNTIAMRIQTLFEGQKY